MHSKPATGPPRGAASEVLVEVEVAVAWMELAKLLSEAEALRRLYENTKLSFDRASMLMPTATRTMSHEEELAVWNRLAPIQRWLESTAGRLRVRR